MRSKYDPQPELDFPVSNLALTQEYYAKYETISKILDENPEILSLVHRELAHALESKSEQKATSRFRYTSDHVLRILVVQSLEGFSLRQTVVRIDDSPALRRFARIDRKAMMDFTTLDKLKNAIGPQTWKRINQALARYAVRQESITGEALRLDTTAVETDIHWPTDSSLLWDSYRVLAGLIEQARKLDGSLVGSGRLHPRRAKRAALSIARKAAKRGRNTEALKPLYRDLLGRIEGLCEWALRVATGLTQRAGAQRYGAWKCAEAEALAQELQHFHGLARRVIDQARRRVFEGESVPNEEKLFSLFEPHTELLKRGKAGKDIEFGHMIQIQQVREKFITDYEVFAKKPVEHTLLAPALESHRTLFGSDPAQLAADKGYYKDMDTLHELEQTIEVVSIAKKGKRTLEETEREQDPLFRQAQAFRAGVEGTISFLKRLLRLARCFNRGWERFVSTVGSTVFAHNLLALARA